MAQKLITAPNEMPVTLADAKLHCRVDNADDDTLITALIASATEQAEHITGRRFVTQTWEMALDAFPAVEIELPLLPVQSITSIKYLDLTSAEQTVPALEYELDNYNSQRQWIIPADDYAWPDTLDSANAVKIQFVCGYGAAAAVPSSIKIWIKMAVGTMYQNREFTSDKQHYELPRDFMIGLLDPFRVYAL